MTNPNAALRLLIVYAIIIPIAILLGYLLTNPLDYGSIGFVVILLALLVSPILIKWHYPIMVFGLAFPAQIFFLPGNPPAWQIVVILSLGIAIVERAINSDKRFLQAPAMTWALVYTVFMAVITMQLTGGFHLHTVDGGTGGGKKYISLYLGVATFFALVSRGIPPAQRKFYIGLFFLSGAFAFIGDLFPFLPPPLNYLNLIFPPSGYLANAMASGAGLVRLTSLANTASVLMIFMLARYGLRGILAARHPIRCALFAILFVLAQLGGFRSNLFANVVVIGFIFFLEGLHRTRLLAVAIAVTFIASTAVVPFARDLPESIQRSLSFLPLDIKPTVRADAEGSTDWRLTIWKALLPKVPGYLLLGKGYSLSVMDYQEMGPNNPFALSAHADASLESLAISNDFHSGPLSTIICFGFWGCLSILFIMGAGAFILYRNYKYGDPALLSVNALLLAMHLEHILHFFLIFGAYDSDVGSFAKYVGFSVALNWGVCRRPHRAVVNVHARPKPLTAEPNATSAPQPA